MKVSASFQLTLSNYSFFWRMEDRTVDCEDASNVEDLVFDETHSERSAWKFCNSKTLHRSEVVFFFQAIKLLILIISCLFKLTFYEIPSEDMPFWVSVLSAAVAYILPSTRL